QDRPACRSHGSAPGGHPRCRSIGGFSEGDDHREAWVHRSRRGDRSAGGRDNPGARGTDGSCAWLNVLVHVEEIVGIVFRLELLKSSKVRPVGGSNRIASLVVSKVVHIAPGPHERLHRSTAVAYPGDAGVVLFRVQ